MQYNGLTVERRIRLERALAARFGKKHADGCLRALAGWVGWRWPLEAEILAAIPYCSRPIRARRLREARAELPAILALPPLTPAHEVSLLRQRIAFRVLPASAIVLPADRVLGPWHALAIVGRGLPMTVVVSRIIGGTWLVDTSILQAELDGRRAEQDARLADLQEEYEAPAVSSAYLSRMPD